MNTLHGELYMDAAGEPHFICHTPGTMSFVEVRDGLLAFIKLLRDQVDRQQECPHYNGCNHDLYDKNNTLLLIIAPDHTERRCSICDENFT